MAFKWTDRVDGQDAALADDVNTLAAGIKENIDNLTAHKNAVIIDHPDGSITHEKLADGIIENNNISDGAVSKNKLSEGLNTTIDVLVKKVFYDTPASWADVQKIVRSGEASTVFNIGDQFVSSHATYGDLVWDVIGIDQDTPKDRKYTHSMTLQLHDALGVNITGSSWGMQFDNAEYTWYIASELKAGTYNFTLPAGYDTGHGGGKTYYFTTQENVPAGGVIRFEWKQNKPAYDGTISTWNSNTATSARESGITVIAGNEGTALPVLNQNDVTANANAVVYTRYGSSSWATSDIRRWLNSKGEANSWWQPQNVFDRAPTYANKAGFLNGLDPEFLKVVGEVTKMTGNNQSYKDFIESSELFFLLSRIEIYEDSPTDNSKAYAYYSSPRSDLTAPGGGADSNRIKYTDGVASAWSLRDPLKNVAYAVSRINTSGAHADSEAVYASGIVPACCIV